MTEEPEAPALTPKGKGAAVHRHAIEEVFIPIKRRWQVFRLEGDTERHRRSR
jgi:hypothetical protein